MSVHCVSSLSFVTLLRYFNMTLRHIQFFVQWTCLLSVKDLVSVCDRWTGRLQSALRNIDAEIPEDTEFVLPNLLENPCSLASCSRRVHERGMNQPSHLQLKHRCADLTLFHYCLSRQHSESQSILNGHQFSLILSLKDPSKRLMNIKLLFKAHSLLSLLAQLITERCLA